MWWFVGIIAYLICYGVFLTIHWCEYKKVFFIGASKFIKEADGFGRRFVWRIDHPDIIIKREKMTSSWALVRNVQRKYFGSDDKVIDYFPYCSIKKAAKILDNYLFDAYMALSLADPLLEKYGE